ncbi:hypothetical protein P3T76_012899 [Phytophthora citrophthora]|uniref:Uncharacterized protein n=1 Tax=Phytophthora citrophthora TaxID=4793 RepID=A0AAD9G4K2_9STRA|nr:hypothetical protein P3T76_012899 [Phytophthora citrophthora]
MDMDSMTEVPIQISQLPVHPSVSSQSPSKVSSPTPNATGCVGFKLSLLTPRKPSLHCCLVFRNFYVASLRIVQVNTDGSSTELVSTYPLMQHVYCEDDAQDWKLVKLDQLPVSWNPHIFDSFYVYLLQPSPLWETWELRDVKLYVMPEESKSEASSVLKQGSADKRPSLTRKVSVTEGRLTQQLEHRTSRSALQHRNSGTDSTVNAVEDQATRCLDLVLRLRELFQQ